MGEEAARNYEFGPFRLDTGQKLLLRAGEVVPLTPKAIDTLLALVNRRGEVVEKEDLMRQVWPDTIVEEGGLAKNISLLRKALGDDADESQYIETIPKRGYRFVAVVRPVGEPKKPPFLSPKKAGLATLALAVVALVVYLIVQRGFGPQPIRSIVILPLQNLAGSDDAFTSGMTEELRTFLGTITALRRVHYPAGKYEGSEADIARQQKVDAALFGSVNREGNRVRVTVHLVQAATGEYRLNRHFEGELGGYMELQSKVAQAIVQEIQIHVKPQERARLASFRSMQPEAMDAYFQGMWFLNRRTGQDLLRAKEYFQQAIAKDPGHARSHTGLADVYALLGSMPYDLLEPKEAGKRAREMAELALRKDASLAEAHTSLGYVKLSFDWDIEGAEVELRRAIELDPSYATAHHWYAHTLIAAKRFREAEAQIRLAQESSPLSLIIGLGAGWCAYQAGDTDRAIEQYRVIIARDPLFISTHFVLGLALAQKNQLPEARASLGKAVEMSGGQLLTAVAALGWVQAKAGDRAGAQRCLRDLAAVEAHRYVPALYRAVIYQTLGDPHQARSWAEKAFEERSEYLVYARVEPLLSGLREEPWFRDLMSRHGLSR